MHVGFHKNVTLEWVINVVVQTKASKATAASHLRHRVTAVTLHLVIVSALQKYNIEEPTKGI